MRKRALGNNGHFPEEREGRTLGWIGVDLDGTLAKSVKSKAAEDIGVPIHRMVKQVKKWLAQGQDVHIFTARVNPYHRRIEALVLAGPLRPGLNATLDKFYQSLTRRIGT